MPEIEETPEGLRLTAPLGAFARTLRDYDRVQSSGMSWTMDGVAHRWHQTGDEPTIYEIRVEQPATEDSWALHKLRQVYDCDCYQPETAHELVRDILRLMPLHQGTTTECERLVGSIGAFHIVLDRLTEADLITHGGSIGGSWLEPEGERLLAILDRIEDFDDWAARVRDEHWMWEPDPAHVDS